KFGSAGIAGVSAITSPCLLRELCCVNCVAGTRRHRHSRSRFCRRCESMHRSAPIVESQAQDVVRFPVHAVKVRCGIFITLKEM
ncbi:MAG: hypothetical protein ACRCV5_16840, partial [Afipia sp.]